jgi:hypothetical protein
MNDVVQVSDAAKQTLEGKLSKVAYWNQLLHMSNNPKW